MNARHLLAALLLLALPAAAATPRVEGRVESLPTLALKSNGSLWRWGGAGLPGTPVLVNITNVVAFSGKYALKGDGTVWDLSDTLTNAAPTQVAGLAGIKAISMGTSHLLAITATDTVVALGDNTFGQLGRGTSGTGNFAAAPVNLPGNVAVAAVYASAQHSMAVLSNGTVYAWGDNRTATLGPGVNNTVCGQFTCVTTPGQVTGLANIDKVVSGATGHLALQKGGVVYRWGRFFVGTANEINVATPAPFAQPTAVTDISLGTDHFLMRTSAAHIWGFGGNAFGQLSSVVAGTLQLTPVQLTSQAIWTAAYGASNRSFIQRNDGQLFALGSNEQGALGDNSQNDQNTPTPVVGRLGLGFFNLLGLNPSAAPQGLAIAGPSNLVAGEAAAYFGTGFFDNGLSKAVDATFTTTNPNVKITPDGRLVTTAAAAGSTVTITGTYTEAGVTRTNQFFVTVAAGSGILRTPSISTSGGSHNLAVRRDGTVVAWGNNPTGTLGDATRRQRSVPVQTVQLSEVQQAVASTGTSLALKGDGTVFQWGTQAGRSPTQVVELGNIAKLSKGPRSNSNFVLDNGGTLSLWDQFTGITSTSAVNVKDVVSTTAELDKDDSQSVGHNVAVRNDGQVYTWGQNTRGELGDNTRTAKSGPQLVPNFTGASQADAGGTRQRQRTLAVKGDGTVWAWGSQVGGVLGDGVNASCSTPTACPASLVPKQVAGLTNVKQVAVGAGHNVVVKNDGTVWAWGDNGHGQLGDGTRTLRTTPVQVLDATLQPLSGIIAVQAGSDHSVALKTDGTVYAWGYNGDGQVGDGTYVDRLRPVLVVGPDTASAVDANNWYLKLDTGLPTTVPARFVPNALATATKTGTDTSIVLEATLRYRTTDFGKSVKNYVLGVVPPEFLNQVRTAPGAETKIAKAYKAGSTILVQLTPLGWTTVDGQLIAYSTGVANASGGAAGILDGVNPTLIPGSQFCVGYGDSADSMLNSAALRDVLALEGAAGTANGLPCVLSGVYVDGPVSSQQGTSATFNASVVGIQPGGTVQFRDGFGALGAPTAIGTMNPAVSKASLTTAALAPGVHSIGVDYPGDALNPAATSPYPVLHAVLTLPTSSLTDLGGPASSAAGSEAIFNAVVTGNAPTGTVQFKDGATNLGTPIPLVSGQATLRISTLAIGTHTITAVYSGDGNNVTSTSLPLTHRVEEYISTQVLLSSSADPSSVGTSVVLTATVTGTNPTGTVSFKDGAAVMATVPLVSGVASMTVTGFAAGVHQVTADYSGDGANPAASSATLLQQVQNVVDPAAATTDSDGDGLTNAVEAQEGLNPFIKDNDVFNNPRLFTMQQYRDFLAREGDAGGISFWANQITGGGATRGQVVDSFFSSPEFQGTIAPVARLYFAYFLRIPDYPGLNFWIGYYKSGNPLASVSQNFATSPEFTARYGALNNSQFVDLVYQNVLGRAPDAGGKAFWQGQLDTNALNRGEVMLGFSESDEYKLAIASEVYVTMIYNGMLRRAPDASGFSFWVQYRDAGNSGLALIDLFLGTPEYRTRFLP